MQQLVALCVVCKVIHRLDCSRHVHFVSDLCSGKGHTDWDGSESIFKNINFDNRNKLNTTEALVNDHLGNSYKWLQLELVAYENGFYHKTCTYYQCCCNNTNKLTFLLPITEAAH